MVRLANPRVGIRLLLSLLGLVFVELAVRGFWQVCCAVPFDHPSRILYAPYPELRRIETERPTHDDAFYDILLLGASTLHRDWGQVEADLLEQLAYGGRRNVRIFNLAKPGHTSRDSRLKYASLATARFELVVFYDGINEARANNAPPEVFRQDYGHFSWYRMVNTLAGYHGAASFALPYTLRLLGIRLQVALRKNHFAPRRTPRQDWIRYGRDSRSAVSFRENLSAILELAARREDPVLLMTFATYVPADYSLEAFKAKRLDYGLHLSPIETWGAPEQVLATVAVQNEVVRSLAAQHKVRLVDQASLLAGSPRYFNDVCHFTAAGSAKFVENLLTGLPPKS